MWKPVLRKAQWLDHSPPTILALVRVLAWMKYVFLSLASRGFPPGTPVLHPVLYLLLKNQHFQIPIQSGTHGHVLRTPNCFVAEQITITIFLKCFEMFIHILNTCGIAVVFSNMPQEEYTLLVARTGRNLLRAVLTMINKLYIVDTS